MFSKIEAAVRGKSSLVVRLSRGLSILVLLIFVLLAIVVLSVISNYLSGRQAKILEERREHVLHLFEEAPEYDRKNELTHKLDDFLGTHPELQIEIRSKNGDIDYLGANVLEHNTHGGKKLTFQTSALSSEHKSAVATISYNVQSDSALLRWLSLTLGLSSILASVIAVFWVRRLVDRELKSVDDLAHQLHQVSAGNLGIRFDGSQQPKELQPIVTQFNALLERLESSYRQLSNFNADVAHELNTPLTTLITSSELELRNSKPDSQLRELLGSNLEELQRMSEIIKSMMFLSRAEQGVKPRHSLVTSVAEVVGDVVDYHETTLRDAGLVVTVVGDGSGEFDVALVKRALSNLLSNAIRYATPSSAIGVEISTKDDEYIHVCVVNTGEPVDTDTLSRMFDRFFRADASRSMADKHHGLGLSIVAAVANMHGGVPHALSKGNETRIGFSMRREQ